MSLVGKNMRHKTWGIGIVEREENNILSVRFFNTTDGEILKRFIFPEALIKGHLVGADEAAQAAISTAKSRWICDRCGKSNVQTITVDGARMCSSCCAEYTSVCCICEKIHLSNKVHFACESVGSYRRRPVCNNCVSEHTFKCEICSNRYLSHNRAKEIFIEHILCSSCAEDVISKCDSCGKRYYIYDGTSVYENEKVVRLCDSCAENKTFRCSECGYREPLSSLVDSRYIPASEKVCKGCAHTCAVCGEYFHINHDMYAFNKYFCPDCWKTRIIKCTICRENFHPTKEGDTLCPDCVEMRAYNARLKELSYLQKSFKQHSHHYLEYLDRCKLFTQLYKNCRMNLGDRFTTDDSESFYYLVVDFSWYKIIVTYVPDNITGAVQISENVTMTEFRSKKGARSVRLAMKRILLKKYCY